MIIVTGHLTVKADDRDRYLAGCATVVAQARQASGCLDFAISADLIDPSRINILERWVSHTALNDFRGSGPDEDQSAAILSASVVDYEV